MAIEDKIERIVELEMNKLDKLLLDGHINEETYEMEVKELDNWANQTYKEFRVNQYLL